ncbi:Formate dehydrogenase H [bacterium HR23]|nr:Formate dehydrogenase H [bacterium HR23]
MPWFIVNGKPQSAPDGVSVLRALRFAGVEVPALCNDDRLAPIGACRLCLVEVEGQARPVPACLTTLQEGMRITTHTPFLENYRSTVLSWLARRYSATAYLAYPDKEFHRWLRAYGLQASLSSGPASSPPDTSHPYIQVDMSLCISCFRCVRICAEVQGQFVWNLLGRGDDTRIAPDSYGPFGQSSCVACGACVDTCPTGALVDKSVREGGAPAVWTRTTCPYCGTGCELLVGTREGRICAVRPVVGAPVNRGHLCVKGRYAFAFNHAPDRITTPLVRRGRRWETTTWDEAITLVAQTFQRILVENGPGSVGILASSRGTNEEAYLVQKFARLVLGTNNVDCCARVCHDPTAAAMQRMLGTGAATNSFDHIEQANCFLICGANPTANHPVVGARIKQRVLKGVPLVAVDPRRTELARLATLHLPLRPGTDIPLLNAIAYTLLEEGLIDETFVAERVEGLEAFRSFIREYTPERVASICGVEAAHIRQSARLYATRKPAMAFHGLGLTEHHQGTETVMALVNLALLTGNIGKPGSGVNPLRGQNNVQGTALMGCSPSILTGGARVRSPQERERFAQIWGAPPPAERGLDALELLDSALAGRLKGLWIIGWDILLTMPNALRTLQALEALEFVVIQDMFLNETAKRVGHVFLPAASCFEREGTFMNWERRIQMVRKALEPPGQARPDGEVVCAVAKAMGYGHFFPYGSPREVWEEIRQVWPAVAGITYDRLEKGGIQWPCPQEGHPGTAILHGEAFSGLGRRTALRLIPYRPTPEVTNPDFPLLLTTGRRLYQFNAGTMTLRSGNTAFQPWDTLDMHPADAERLGVQEGQKVRVRSRYGEVVLPVHITAEVKPGECFATFHTPVLVNAITSPMRDEHVHTPEYKVTAVRVEPL